MYLYSLSTLNFTRSIIADYFYSDSEYNNTRTHINSAILNSFRTSNCRTIMWRMFGWGLVYLWNVGLGGINNSTQYIWIWKSEIGSLDLQMRIHSLHLGTKWNLARSTHWLNTSAHIIWYIGISNSSVAEGNFYFYQKLLYFLSNSIKTNNLYVQSRSRIGAVTTCIFWYRYPQTAHMPY